MDEADLCTPSNAAELAIVRSLLDAERIPYFVRNEHFGAMVGGLAGLGALHPITIVVPAEWLEEARAVLAAYDDASDAGPDEDAGS